MSNERKFAIRLQSYLEENKIKQSDLADQCGITRQSISAYIKGKSEPTATVIADIAQNLNLSADYLLGLSEDNSNKPYDEKVKTVASATGLSKDVSDQLINSKNVTQSALNRLLLQRDFWKYLHSYAQLIEYCNMAQRIVEGGNAADICDGSDFLDELYEYGAIDSLFENSQIISELIKKTKTSIFDLTIATEFFHSLPVKANRLCNRLEETRKLTEQSEYGEVQKSIAEAFPPDNYSKETDIISDD